METADLLQAVELKQEGRIYGVPYETPQWRTQQEPAPEIGQIFLEDIKERSAILALSNTSTRQQVFEAYAADVDALTQRRQEADAFMLDVVICAMERFHVSAEKQKQEIALLRSLLEPLGIAPEICLTAERCSMPVPELVEWIQIEFYREIDKIARRIAATLDHLAEHNVVGLLEWKDTDICKFHYFTWNTQHAEKTIETSMTGDIFAWNTVTTKIENVTRLNRIRHTHHVVNAGMHTVHDYARPMPPRVRALLKKAPPWLAPHLVVVDGTETLTERVTCFAGEQASVRTESVTRYDPAIELGRFVFAGWNESDLLPEPRVSFFTRIKQSWLPKVLQLLMVIFVLELVYLASVLVIPKSESRSYQDYLTSLPRQTLHVTSRQGAIELPTYPYVFLGGTPNGDGVRLRGSLGSGNKEPGNNISIKLNRFRDELYGDINLRKLEGIPFIVHVQSATDAQIVYSVERLN